MAAFDFGKWFGILTTLAPLIFAIVPGGQALAPFVPIIVTAMGEAQQLAGASGLAKKGSVLALVGTAATATNLVKPGTVDPTLLQQAVGEAIDAVITSVNAVQLAHANLPAVPPLLAPVVASANAA